MTLIHRAELKERLKDILTEGGPRLFLFFGERFLCRKAADQLQEAFLSTQDGNLISIDGDTEDPTQTLAKLMSYSLLPGLQLYRVNDTRLFHSKNISQSIWNKVCKAFKNNRTEQCLRYLTEMYTLLGTRADQRQPLTELSNQEWQSGFGFPKPDDLSWTDQLFEQLHQQNTPVSTGDISDHYIESLKGGIPPNNFLILTAENVDKRKRLFTFLKKHGVVVDCSVAQGSGAAAQKVQKSVLQEIMVKTLKKHNKTIEAGALDIFLERIGFHPVAVVMETEKLILYAGERKKITLDDLNLMVARSREDALFELTDNLGKRDLRRTLTTLHHLLENGVHGLAIVATLRNYLRKLLLFRTIQHQSTPAYHRNMTPKQFQDNYLPQLKQFPEWQEILKGHPYGLFMSFSKAAEFSCSNLKSYMAMLLSVEYSMKGSGMSERILLEYLLVSIIHNRKTATR